MDYEEITDLADIKAKLTADVIGSSVELPVNKGILVGGDGLVKLFLKV